MADSHMANQPTQPSHPNRIAKLTLDEKSVIRRSREIEHERNVALFDLMDMNRFQPVGEYHGPFMVKLGIEEGTRLKFDIADDQDKPLTITYLPLSPFRGVIRDYFRICESYYDAVKKLTPAQIETIDMARRGIHNDGAELLRDSLDGKIEIDKQTARRLFTLICVLHIR